MSDKIDLDKVYTPAEDVVVQEIEGEVVIFPLVSEIGDIEDELFTLSETSRGIWERIDGSKPLAAVVRELAEDCDGPPGIIEGDVVCILEELLERRMIVEKG